MSNVVYLCPHCKTKKGHSDSRHVRVCEIQNLEIPNPDEILEYVILKEELDLEFMKTPENPEVTEKI